MEKNLVNNVYRFFSEDNSDCMEEGVRFAKELLKTNKRLSLQLSGYCYFRLENLRKAYEKYIELIEENDTSLQANEINIDLSELRSFYIELKGSWERIFNIIHKEKKEVGDLKELGQNLFCLGFYEETIAYYKEYLEFNDDYEPTFYLAEILERLGRKSESIKYYEKVEKLMEGIKDLHGFKEASGEKIRRLR